MLGFDIAPDDVSAALRAVLAGPVDLDGERRLLEVYADVRALTRPHVEDEPEAELVGSPQERLHAYLRSLDPAAEGLPSRFVEHLERALAHYGVDGLERTPALQHAAYRLFLSQQRAEPARAAVRAVLSRHLDRADELSGDSFRDVLDRLETALAPREPALAELARELRWRTATRRWSRPPGRRPTRRCRSIWRPWPRRPARRNATRTTPSSSTARSRSLRC